MTFPVFLLCPASSVLLSVASKRKANSDSGISIQNCFAKTILRKQVIHVLFCGLLRLNQMLYALCLSYHFNSENVLFACFSLGWVTTMFRVGLLGPFCDQWRS